MGMSHHSIAKESWYFLMGMNQFLTGMGRFLMGRNHHSILQESNYFPMGMSHFLVAKNHNLITDEWAPHSPGIYSPLMSMRGFTYFRMEMSHRSILKELHYFTRGISQHSILKEFKYFLMGMGHFLMGMGTWLMEMSHRSISKEFIFLMGTTHHSILEEFSLSRFLMGKNQFRMGKSHTLNTL